MSGRGEPVGRDEAAAAVGIGRALAVYHLDKLVEAGLLTATYRRPPCCSGPGAGRPAKVYARSCGEFMVTVPMREYELAARLLVQAVAADRSGQAGAALQAAAWKLGADLAERHQADQDGPQPASEERAVRVRLRAAAGRGRRRPDAERPVPPPGGTGAELVCRMNLALIRGLAAGLDAGGLHPVLDPEPGHCCVAIPAATPATNGTI